MKNVERKIELPRSKLTGYQDIARACIPKASPPNVLIGSPVPVSPGFPIEAFGNDGVQEIILNARARRHRMRIGIATDHGGFSLKEELLGQLHAVGNEVVDFGVH